MRNVVYGIICVILLLVVTLFTLEGVASVYQWRHKHTSVLYGAWHRLKPANAAFPGVVTDERQLTSLIPKMIDAGVALGNAPFPELKTDKASIVVDDNGCRVLKPDMHKTALQIRSGLYEPLDPISAYYDRDTPLPAELDAFFKSYGFGFHNMTTNANGERLTVPTVERPRKVLIAGDSMAFGAMLDDSRTLASSLQLADDARQYISVGVPGATPAEILCNLERGGARYRGQVDELIYFYSEGDLNQKKIADTPEQIMARVKAFAGDQSASKVTVIYAPYIYNVVPQFTRYVGYRGEEFPNLAEPKKRLRGLVDAAGFRWIDIGEMALADSARYGTQFATLALFADHAHLSPYGMERLVAHYRANDVALAPQ
jgi:hypothetical protein